MGYKPIRLLSGGQLRDKDKDDFDPWALADDDNEYGPDKFYTRSIDGRGHKETFHTPVPPAIYGQVGAIVSSGVISAYRTPQDFVRDAIVHRLHDLAIMKKAGKLNKSMNKAAMYEEVLCNIAQMNQEMSTVQTIVQEMEMTLTNAARSGDGEILDRALETAKEQAEQLREPYRSQVKSTIRTHQRQH